MDFEQIPSENKIEKEKVSLYPERPFLRVDYEIERLKMFENGEIKKIELTEEEREKMLEYENFLGAELERISDIKINSQTFYPEYFLTEGGRQNFFQVTGLEIIGNNMEEIKQFLLANRSNLNSIDGKKISGLAGKSETFNDERIAESLDKTMDENGEISVENLTNPERVVVVLNPNDACKKIQSLRQYKRKISEKAQGENKSVAVDSMKIALKKIRELYRKKVNVMIANQASYGIWANELAFSIGDEQLTQEEEMLKETVPGLLKFEKILSRYDRFIHGANVEYNEDGIRKQIGKELLDYVDKIAERYSYNQLRKEELIRRKGFNAEKIKEKNIDVNTFSKWAEDLLEFYGEKSNVPAEEYDPKRTGSASDNKWQFIAREEYKSMAVDSKQKIIKSGVKNKSITETLGTLLGHEFTHFIQAKNKSKIPLRIFSDKLGGFRSEVFAEGGAMAIENEVSGELFGYETGAHPHYITAMAKKLEGGTYLECIKAFYDSGLAILKHKKESKTISEDDFIKEAWDLLKLAINRTKRLFADGDKFNQSGPYLTKSKDAVYAEQIIVMEKLKKSGLEKCAFISGVNLDTLLNLMEIGLIDLDKIEKPNLDFVRKIWEREKHKYASS